MNKLKLSNLTNSQFHIWTGQKLNPHLPLYNMALAFFIQGNIEPEAFRDAFQTLIDRSDSLRTVINDKDDVPLQNFRETLTFDLEFIDFSKDSAHHGNIKSWLKSRSILNFDLKERLFDSVLIKLREGEYVWYINQHQLITDGWSCAVIYRRMAEFYQLALNGRLADAPELPSYLEYQNYEVKFQESTEHRKALAYWQGRNGSAPAPLELYGNTPSAHSTLTERVYYDLGRERSEKLRGLATEKDFRSFSPHLSLFNILSALLFAYLYRISGNSELVIGTPSHNRPTATFQETVGLFIEMFPLGINIEPGETFRSLVKSITSETYDFFRYAHPGCSNAVTHKSYSVVLNYINVAFPDFCGMPMQSTWLHPGHTDMGHALQLQVHDFDSSGSFQFHFDFNCEVFDQDLRGKAVGHFFHLLDMLLADPDQMISALTLLTDNETRQFDTWNDTRVDYPEDVCLHQLFEAQVERTPDEVALIFEGESLTYREMNVQANRLAHYLRTLGTGPDVPVGICADRSIEMVIGLYAILKAGGAYVPLDPNYPKDLLDYMLEDSKVSVVLVQRKLIRTIPQDNLQVLCLDELLSDSCSLIQPGDNTINIDNNPECITTPENMAYVIFTSGSTGRPKGVMNSHRGICNRLLWMQDEYSLTSEDVVLQKTPFSFDVSVWEFFWPLLTGARLVVARPGGHRDTDYLVNVICEQGVTTLHFVPSMLHYFLEDRGAGSCDSLKRVICSGEALPYALQEQFFSKMKAELHNLYGPTEAAVDVTYWKCQSGSDLKIVPIGRPVANTRMFILDHHMHPVPVGVPGELHIGGVQVALGYINRQELTKERFIPDPFSDRQGARLYKTGDLCRYLPDGNIEYLGRNDFQVKIHGIRIELGEIEAVLGDEPGVKQCVVVAREDNSGDKHLVAYLVTQTEAPSIDELRKELKKKLADYMIPSVFVMLDELPLSPNGKIDRKALPEPDSARPDLDNAYEEPRTNNEKILARIWADVIGLNQVGIHDNFFDLGGDSIMSIQIAARSVNAGLEFTPGLLLQHQTIAELIANIEAGHEQRPGKGSVPLTPIQQWFFDFDLPEPHIWNMAQNLDLSREITPAILEQAFKHLILHHDSLRLRFQRKASGWEQAVSNADNSFALEYYNLSDQTEPEQATSIDRSMQQAHLSLDLQKGPLIRALYFDRGGDQPCQLGIIIHHLVVDGISWYIILEDLETICRDLTEGKTPLLSRKTTPFNEWAEKFVQYANSQACESEADYWIGQVRPPTASLPRDIDHPGNGLESSAQTITVKLEPQATHDLLHKVNLSSRISVDEMLLAALMQTLCNWSGSSVLRVDKEGHGREGVIKEVSLYHTLGWFTSLYPLSLVLPDEHGPGQIIRSVKEQIRAIPNRGFGYSPLRYLSKNRTIRDAMKQVPDAEVIFNYLGTLHELSGQSSRIRLNGFLQGVRGLKGQRPHLIEINSCVIHDQLEAYWTFSTDRHRPETIQGISRKFLQSLQGLINHCMKPSGDEPSASDFPLANLNAEKLAKLSRLLDKSDKAYE